jgi:arylformamidase
MKALFSFVAASVAVCFLAPLPTTAQEKSVKPGINKPFENPDLKDFLQKFEGESREIAVNAKEIVAACKLKPGMVIADVGAGTGLFTRTFAAQVGDTGKVFAADIAPTFLRHIEKTCEADKIMNVETIQCDQFSTKLPKNSVDLVFICDTYHHFEFPQRTLQSIHDALRPGGRIILIDFHRIEGKSREFIMGHVRAGQEVFVREVKSAGFKVIGEENFLKENYFVRFEKVLIPADEPKVHKGIPYAQPKNERQMLDVYSSPKGKDLPVVLWIHGGGWRAGDKANVQMKPQAFVDKGYVFVATNHRFFPNVTVKEMTGDIAKAIRWIHDHARDYGGDPKSIFVMGHSSGAHLAALVCTDERYLKAEGLPLSIIKGCVPVDVSMYDIPKRIEDSRAVIPKATREVFGNTEDSWRDLSPVTHVAKGKNVPPFLILHVAARPETKNQSHWLADKLKEAGVPAQIVAAEGTTHGTINANLGNADDRPTQEMWAFLNASISKVDAGPTEQIDSLKKLGARITVDEQKRIVGVNLGERKVTDSDLVHLKGHHHLQELDLTRTQVTGKGLVHIKDLPALRKLFLTQTKVDDAGIENLKGMRTLTLIGFSGTKITDAALDHLREMTELRQVFCLGNGVTDAGLERLKRALPKCQITH